jgi:hypothetical protein
VNTEVAFQFIILLENSPRHAIRRFSEIINTTFIYKYENTVPLNSLAGVKKNIFKGQGAGPREDFFPAPYSRATILR